MTGKKQKTKTKTKTEQARTVDVSEKQTVTMLDYEGRPS